MPSLPPPPQPPSASSTPNEEPPHVQQQNDTTKQRNSKSAPCSFTPFLCGGNFQLRARESAPGAVSVMLYDANEPYSHRTPTQYAPVAQQMQQQRLTD